MPRARPTERTAAARRRTTGMDRKRESMGRAFVLRL
jgi:hypothetical protein